MLDCTWKEHFRVDRSTFFYIVRLVGHRLRKQNNQFRDAIPVDKRVACSLWRLGTGECYGSLGEQFGAGCKTADEINLDFLYTIFEHYHQFIHFPDSEQEIQTAIGKYGELLQIPQVYLLTYLVIDGTYIKIKSPDDDLDDYICRKGYHSTILQAAVGADTETFDASTGYPGNMHHCMMQEYFVLAVFST